MMDTRDRLLAELRIRAGELNLIRFASASGDWVQSKGPRGGIIWTRGSQKRYQKNKPGSGKEGTAKPASKPAKSAPGDALTEVNAMMAKALDASQTPEMVRQRVGELVAGMPPAEAKELAKSFGIHVPQTSKAKAAEAIVKRITQQRGVYLRGLEGGPDEVKHGKAAPTPRLAPAAPAAPAPKKRAFRTKPAAPPAKKRAFRTGQGQAKTAPAAAPVPASQLTSSQQQAADALTSAMSGGMGGPAREAVKKRLKLVAQPGPPSSPEEAKALQEESDAVMGELTTAVGSKKEALRTVLRALSDRMASGQQASGGAPTPTQRAGSTSAARPGRPVVAPAKAASAPAAKPGLAAWQRTQGPNPTRRGMRASTLAIPDDAMRPALLYLLHQRARKLGLVTRFATGARAPTGGVSVQGTHYPGGQFIPGEVMAQATPAEKVAVEGKSGKPAAKPGAAAGKPDPGMPRQFGSSGAKVDVGMLGGMFSGVKGALGTFFKNAKVKPSVDDLADLAGAMEDAKNVEARIIRHVRGGPPAAIEIKWRHENLTQPCIRRIEMDLSGEPYIKNEIIIIDENKRAGGMGTKVFGRGVETARRLGIRTIRCHAARAAADGRMTLADGSPPRTGYHQWPSMGYDESFEVTAKYNPEGVAKVREAFPGVASIQELYAREGGKEWWKANGFDLTKMQFDVTDGSTSMKKFAEFIKDQDARIAAKKATPKQ